MNKASHADILRGSSLSPLQRPLCVVGRLGRKEERERGTRWEGEREKRGSRLSPLPIVPRALSIVSIIAIFIGIPSGSLLRGERVRQKNVCVAHSFPVNSLRQSFITASVKTSSPKRFKSPKFFVFSCKNTNQHIYFDLIWAGFILERSLARFPQFGKKMPHKIYVAASNRAQKIDPRISTIFFK